MTTLVVMTGSMATLKRRLDTPRPRPRCNAWLACGQSRRARLRLHVDDTIKCWVGGSRRAVASKSIPDDVALQRERLLDQSLSPPMRLGWSGQAFERRTVDDDWWSGAAESSPLESHSVARSSPDAVDIVLVYLVSRQQDRLQSADRSMPLKRSKWGRPHAIVENERPPTGSQRRC